jgi:predicted HTH transcriptional regulator
MSGSETNAMAPSIAGFLMLGDTDRLQKEISAAGTVYTIETSVTKPLTSWNWLNIVESLASFIPLLTAELSRRDAELPGAVIAELLVNAYVHRCYRTAGAIQIRIKEKEIEIQNPGGLLGDLTTESILYSPPIYRNFALADAMRQFGFCEKAGTGIDKVFYTLLAAGLDFPIFHSEGNSFSVIIRTQKDLPFAKMVKNHAGELKLTVTDLVVMRGLRTRGEAGLEYLAKLAQRPSQYMEGSLRDLQRRKIVDATSRSRYRLAEPLLNQIARYDDEAQGNLF